MTALTIGEFLRAARLGKKNHLTLEDVARLTGLSVATLSSYESGRREPPSTKLLLLAKLYDADLHELARRFRLVREATPELRGPVFDRAEPGSITESQPVAGCGMEGEK